MLKENIKLIILISLIAIVSLSSTYAFIQLNATSNTATGTGGCFNVNYSGSTEVNNSEAVTSTTQYTTVKSTTIELSKSTGCDIYTEASIYLHTDSSNNTAPLCLESTNQDYIDGCCSMKYQVMQGDTVISSGTVNKPTNENDDQILATVPLTDPDPDTGKGVSYDVYLWIDSSTSKGIYHGTTYSGSIYASAIQSSTIK